MKEKKRDGVRKYAAEMVSNFDANNKVVGIFEEHGAKCDLGWEDFDPKSVFDQFIITNDESKIEIVDRETAEKRGYELVNNWYFLNICGTAESLVKKETSPAVKEEAAKFNFAFLGDKDKVDVIERVFEKHGVPNTARLAFLDTDGIYYQHDGHVVYSPKANINWLEIIGFTCCTIDSYLSEHPEDKDCLEAPKPEEEKEILERLKKEREEDFKELSASIIRFMNQSYCHPHMTIIADCNHVELLEGLQCEHGNK